jgi:hypothetical protein
MRSKDVPAIVAPNVPPKTMRKAGTLKRETTDVPSSVAPRARSTRPATIPMAVEAFIPFVIGALGARV